MVLLSSVVPALEVAYNVAAFDGGEVLIPEEEELLDCMPGKLRAC